MQKAIYLFIGFLLATPRVQSQSFELRGGFHSTPGNYVSLGYKSSAYNPFQLSISAYEEQSAVRGLSYKAIGLDFLLGFEFNSDQFSWSLAAGPSFQYETEPWIYAGLSLGKKINIGAAGELSAHWYFSQSFSLSGFIQQKYFLNSSLGHTRFIAGIGLAYSFGN